MIRCCPSVAMIRLAVMKVSGLRKRIMIIGQPGSGKSTLARILGKTLNLPVFHTDHIGWQPGWIERAESEKIRLCSEIHARDKWVFEGGRSPERLDRADTLVFLDFPLLIRAWRVLKRRVEYHKVARPDVPEDCPENINWEFVSYIWRTRKTGRSRLIRFFDTAPVEKDRYRLQNRFDFEKFLNEISNP